MSFSYFFVTFKQVGVLLFYIAVGFILRRTGKFNKGASGIFATLLVYFVAPCYTFLNMTENFSFALLSTYLEMFIIGIIVMIICLIISFLITRFFAPECYKKIDDGTEGYIKNANKTDYYMKNVYKYIFAFANLGFFGNPLVEAIFGGSALVQYMIFSLPMSIALSTYGFVILTDTGVEKTKEEKRKHLIKVFTTPSIIFLFLGIIFGLLSIKLPQIVKDFITPAKTCYTAIPMILLGNVLGGFELKKLFSSKKAYLVGVIKLIVIPLICGVLAYVSHVLGVNDFTCLLIVLMTALPPGMNVVTYPESFGIDSSENAKMLFVSYIMCLVTLPIFIMIATTLLGI